MITGTVYAYIDVYTHVGKVTGNDSVPISKMYAGDGRGAALAGCGKRGGGAARWRQRG